MMMMMMMILSIPSTHIFYFQLRVLSISKSQFFFTLPYIFSRLFYIPYSNLFSYYRKNGNDVVDVLKNKFHHSISQHQ